MKIDTEKLGIKPLGYWEEDSYFIAPLATTEVQTYENADAFIDSFKAEGIEVKQFIPQTEEHPMLFAVLYKGEEYRGGLYFESFSFANVPAMLGEKLFTKEEYEALTQATGALTLFMHFGADPKVSFHLQLKLISIFAPKLLGVLDESAERLFGAKWVKMAAMAETTPGPGDIYSVQAISDESQKVWLHTHGLIRCGIPELEIVESSQEKAYGHYHLLSAYASKLIDDLTGENDDDSDASFIGVLSNNTPIVATYRLWPVGLKEYSKVKMGGKKDRDDEHSSYRALVFVYASEKDMTKKKLSKVDVYNDLLDDNPLYFFSDEETERMSNLARERFNYVEKAFTDKNNNVLLKIAAKVLDDEPGKREHIWFELKDVDNGRLQGELTQEAYGDIGLKPGDTAWYTVEDITDWIIFTPEGRITPNTAYMLA